MKSSKRTQIPEDWTIPEDYKEFPKSRGWVDASINEQAERFHDYHMMHGSLMASWKAAWRTWVRRAEEYGKVTKVSKGGMDPEALDRAWKASFGTERPKIQ